MKHRPRRMCRFRAVCLLLFLVCCDQVLRSQAAKPIGTPKNLKNLNVDSTPIPVNHMYWHFFSYQMHLDKAASDHEKKGKDGRWLRDRFGTELGFSDADLAIVRAAALRVTGDVAKLDREAQTIIAADRATSKAGSLPPGAVPPGIPMLKLLTQDRENILKTQISLMNESLGPQKAQTLELYLKQHTTASRAGEPNSRIAAKGSK